MAAQSLAATVDLRVTDPIPLEFAQNDVMHNLIGRKHRDYLVLRIAAMWKLPESMQGGRFNTGESRKE